MGLSLASWSLFVGTPFGTSPQLAAVASTFLAIVFALFALVLGAVGDATSVVFTLIFPPAFYIFAVRSMAGFEVHQIPTNVLDPDPDSGMRLLPILIAGIVSEDHHKLCAYTDSVDIDRYLSLAIPRYSH